MSSAALELVFVAGIVALAAVYVGRRIYAFVEAMARGGCGGHCGCGRAGRNVERNPALVLLDSPRRKESD